jgi:hypothetical protein
LESFLVIKFSDCFNSGYIIKSNLEIIGGALYLQQKIDQSFFNRLLCSKANSPGGFPGAVNRKNEANFDGCFEKVNLYEIFYFIKIGGKILFTEKWDFFLHKSSSRDKQNHSLKYVISSQPLIAPEPRNGNFQN